MSKSKRLRGALVAAFAGSALAGLLAISGAGAQGTAPPVQFYGSVSINGAAAPVAGTQVTVSAGDGTLCVTSVNGGTAPNVIEPSGGETIYGAQVQAQGAVDEDPCTFAAGDDVVFAVNGTVATTIEFVSTPPLQEVDLAITEATETPTETATETPTGTATGTPTGTATATGTATTGTPAPPSTGVGGGSDEGSSVALALGLAVAAAAGLGASGFVLVRRNSR
jgi:hypothetical protein